MTCFQANSILGSLKYYAWKAPAPQVHRCTRPGYNRSNIDAYALITGPMSAPGAPSRPAFVTAPPAASKPKRRITLCPVVAPSLTPPPLPTLLPSAPVPAAEQEPEKKTKKQRITLTPLEPVGAEPRSLEQLGGDFDQQVNALVDAVDSYKELSHSALMYTDVEDVDRIMVLASKLKRSIRQYQQRANQLDQEDKLAEEQRQKEIVPVKLDQKEHKAIYRKHRAVLGGDHKTLWRCPFAHPDGVCRVHANPARHFGPAPRTKVLAHIAKQHIATDRDKDLYSDYHEGVSGGWIV